MRSIPIGDHSGEISAADYIPPLAADIPSDLAGMRLDQALARLFPQHSRSRLQHWVREGRVTLDDGPADPKRKVYGGERVSVTPEPPPAETAFRPEAIELSVVHEDDTLLVIDKPAGMVVHPGSGNWEGTMLNALLHHAPQLERVPRAGIVHRLDKDTSGLLVVAKTLEAQTELVRQLQSRTVKRVYLALVYGLVDMPGTVDAPIGRHPVERVRMAVTARGKPARTHYEVIESFDDCTLLRCHLETGRTHQIRVHMHSIAHPLVGDPLYGRRQGRGALAGFNRQALHAEALGLVHPSTGEHCEWQAPLPADFAELLRALREAG